MKNTIIISAFPCSGKTTVTESLKDFYDFSDSDSSNYSWLDKENGIRNPDFPNNYLEHIESLLGEKDVVFVSSHKEVRNILNEKNIPYVLVYPENTFDNKIIWTTRALKRGSDEKLVGLIVSNWDDMLDDMAVESCPIHYVLGAEGNRNALDAISIEDIVSCAKSYFYGEEN